MPSPVQVRPPRNEPEATELAFIVLHALSPVAQPTLQRAEAFVQRTGLARMRLAVRRGEVLGGLVLLRMGQFFGGRSVPMTGVSAVAVSAEHRSLGVGRALLVAALREMAARGEALSALYPATFPIYRRLGWEVAGIRQQWEVPTRTLALGARTPPVRRMVDADRAALHACFHEWARRVPGALDRIDWTWQRVLESPDAEVRCHVVDAPRGRGIEGYVVATRTPTTGFMTELDVRDLVALTPRALRRLLSLLGDHRSVAPTTLLRLGPGDAALALPPEPERRLVMDQRFMLRIVDLPAMMAARGFAAGLRAEVTVEIEDPVLAPRRRTWTLRCARGRGVAEPAARGARARCGIGALAAIASGHSSPHEMALAGLLDGDEASLQALGAVFAGPQPWTADMW